MRISDWSSDVCSSDLFRGVDQFDLAVHLAQAEAGQDRTLALGTTDRRTDLADLDLLVGHRLTPSPPRLRPRLRGRSEEHTSELQSLMRISYAVFCLKKKNKTVKTE